MSAAESEVMGEVQQVDQTEVEQKARLRGWRPKDQFKGAPERWVDAESYLKRSEELIPHLRNSNRELTGQVERLNQRLEEQDRLLKANNAALAELNEAQTQSTIEDVEQKAKAIRQQIIEARKAGDEETAAQLEDQYFDARDALREAKAKPKKTTTAAVADTSKTVATITPESDPDLRSFIDENPWWTENPVMRAASIAVGERIRQSAEFPTLSRKNYYGRVAFETLREFGKASREPMDQKVGAPRGDSGVGSGTVKIGSRFEDMPADAQAACNRLASRFVGKAGSDGKVRYKDAAAWRQNYAEKYFGPANRN